MARRRFARFDEEPTRLKGGQRMSIGKRRWKLIPFAVVAALVAAFAVSSATARTTASTIKIAVLSDCQGAFGAFANYAKQHPTKTFVDGSAGAQDTTLKVRAPNFFRFNGDGAQWNAGLGDLAYNKLKWRTAAVVADDYSFAWTSAAGFIAEFCAVGGKISKRVFPPLNTTDYSSYAQQMPTNVDGTFVAVGGAGLIPFLKAYEQAHGPIDGKKFIGNLFWGTPGQFEQLSTRVTG